MFKHTVLILIYAIGAPAVAQSAGTISGVATDLICSQGAFNSSGASGDSSHASAPTGQGHQGMGGWDNASYRTTRQRATFIPTRTAGLAPVFGPRSRNGLPPCNLDSFVYEAKEHAEHIYGDEGTEGPPPYYGFTQAHRINTGIMENRDRGLTTGNGSLMPDAWGGDEFIGAEFTRSGARAHSASGYSLPVFTATRVNNTTSNTTSGTTADNTNNVSSTSSTGSSSGSGDGPIEVGPGIYVW